MENRSIERNITLDYFKIFLSILVITIHIKSAYAYQTDDFFGWAISNGIARIAVPCFFIINGYFIGENIRNFAFVKSYIFKLFVIYITWTIIYTPVFINDGKKLMLSYLFSGFHHLWYVVALILGVLLLYILKRYIKSNKLLLIISVLLFFTGYYLQNNFQPVILVYAKIAYYRNAIFMGFPFIFLGYFIKNLDISKIKSAYLYLLFVIAFTILLIEAYYSEAHKSDFYCSLFVICPVLFILVMQKSKYTISDGYVGKIASGIYFVHFLILMLLSRQEIVYTKEKYMFLLPIIIFLSMLASTGVVELNKRIKIFL